MTSYIDSINQQRVERDKHMTANPLNWLALCGLFQLGEGENTFGSEKTNPISLPGFPATKTGVLTLADGKVSLTDFFDTLTVNGNKPEARPLRTDHDGNPDNIEAGSLTLRIIQRGAHIFVRAWDSQADAVKAFKGLKYYPVKPEYCINAKFTPYEPPVFRTTYDVIGDEHETAFAGQAEFTVDGVACHLEAEDADDELLFNFTDQTKADTTYPGGRYITIPKPVADKVLLDFNMAVNWPCAYTSFATCPLPPFENRLPVRIEAGEMRYHD